MMLAARALAVGAKIAVRQTRCQPPPRPRVDEGSSGHATETETPMTEDRDPRADLPEHPTGTLVIVALYGLHFVVGWLLFYFKLFLPRGPVR